ncbi:unnamed protein product [Oikopleura dioica]|uniref:Uncharacterized protein n=1 Tax=Oikopleura dioica TaxID=34765 RepID=E4XTT8_OIKDI|nr:unnamed protein product [Oikopleura dioica]
MLLEEGSSEGSGTTETLTTTEIKTSTTASTTTAMTQTISPALNQYQITANDLGTDYDETNYDLNIKLQNQYEKTACKSFDLSCIVIFPCDYRDSDCSRKRRQADNDLIVILLRTSLDNSEAVKKQLQADFDVAKTDPDIDPVIKEKLTLVVQDIEQVEKAEDKCTKNFVKSTTGIITITVVTVLSVFYIVAAGIFIFKYANLMKTVIIVSGIIIFELVMVLMFFTVLESKCKNEGISPALGGGLIGVSIFVWLALTIGMYIFQNRRKVSEKKVSFAISDVTNDDSVSMNQFANPFDD